METFRAVFSFKESSWFFKVKQATFPEPIKVRGSNKQVMMKQSISPGGDMHLSMGDWVHRACSRHQADFKEQPNSWLCLNTANNVRTLHTYQSKSMKTGLTGLFHQNKNIKWEEKLGNLNFARFRPHNSHFASLTILTKLIFIYLYLNIATVRRQRVKKNWIVCNLLQLIFI